MFQVPEIGVSAPILSCSFNSYHVTLDVQAAQYYLRCGGLRWTGEVRLHSVVCTLYRNVRNDSSMPSR